jgi:hypothetical protein
MASTSSFNSASMSIPVVLESPQTYEYMGVTAEVATQLYDARKNSIEEMRRESPEDDPNYWGLEFESYLTDNVVRICEAALETDPSNWVRAMSIAGIREDLQMAIMDPDFEDNRRTQTLLQWIRETFGMNVRTLQTLKEHILTQSDSASE